MIIKEQANYSCDCCRKSLTKGERFVAMIPYVARTEEGLIVYNFGENEYDEYDVCKECLTKINELYLQIDDMLVVENMRRGNERPDETRVNPGDEDYYDEDKEKALRETLEGDE